MKKLILVISFCLTMAISFSNTTSVPTAKEVPGTEKTERSALEAICKGLYNRVLSATGDSDYALDVIIDCMGW